MASQTAASAASAERAGVARLVSPYVRAARPLQWTKNLLVFAGIIFAKRLDDGIGWLEASTAFVAYCSASSAGYLLNDVVDAARDRAHPLKRTRAIAAREIAPRSALTVAAVLAAVALLLVVPLGPISIGLVAAFLALQAAYSLALKHLVLIDVIAIASLFVLRAAAGSAAVGAWLSPWLVLCTGLLALFLALAKRRAELALAPTREPGTRPVLGSYSLAFVDQLVAIVTASTISAYALYTFTASESSLMMFTIPPVLFGLFRYLQLVYDVDPEGEEPERVLVTDVPLLLAMATWAIAAVTILALD